MARSKNTEGALYMAAAMAAFSCSDALSKSVISVMNAGEIMLLRGLLTSVIVYLIARHLGALRSFKVIAQPMILLRVVCEALAAATYISALGMMPIANASAIIQALPLAVTLGAALFLKEPVGWRRWSAITVGFLGVLVIVRPGPEGFTPAALIVIASVFITAARDLATRCVDKQVPSLMVTVCTAIGVSLIGGILVVPLGGWHSPGPVALMHLALASVMVLAGYQTAILAMRTGDIAVVAPMRYLSLIFAALLGMIFFGEMPDLWTAVGAAIVIASGLYTFYRESRRKHASQLAQRSDPRVPV
ncbi:MULTISPECIES: DMT family transporter [Rhizobium]|uniref:DMT family transporter n=1 Tax=Rhizobium rhododendri TaxID=2506430 RepID=A0ABY8IMJ0_9HYPH|nr:MULTISPECIES: DMT family transporter [Rhizobium]MBZ5758261.1 DMT family transporter [Rhizobium sp. VS19-DR96]MBZ5764909.1 DMT family transporter [Rhizobium sp. VS19-DR129.2]MBZ5772452.1 DMT family transporter [Rhizobium sp. VS19-DRK62.2]MBZ5782861.1 DMT family transporter [Rhizobium sp. VS19-DR121]MBZ5800309.1 DMT family transporter [Rhizobium sp. VS19-DR181]